MSNKVISIEYTLYDADTKEQLDTNVGQPALEFISGQGQIIPGLEKELLNLKVGDNSEVTVKPEDAYGEYHEEAVQSTPKEQFSDIELTEGMTLYGTGENGETIQVIVKEIGENDVIIDYNHPMAGITLVFMVTLLSSRDATEEELQQGHIGGEEHSHDGCCGSGHCSS